MTAVVQMPLSQAPPPQMAPPQVPLSHAESFVELEKVTVTYGRSDKAIYALAETNLRGDAALVRRLEVEIPKGIRGAAVIGVFYGDAGAADRVPFTVFYGAGDTGLGREPAGKQDEGDE